MQPWDFKDILPDPNDLEEADFESLPKLPAPSCIVEIVGSPVGDKALGEDVEKIDAKKALDSSFNVRVKHVKTLTGPKAIKKTCMLTLSVVDYSEERLMLLMGGSPPEPGDSIGIHCKNNPSFCTLAAQLLVLDPESNVRVIPVPDVNVQKDTRMFCLSSLKPFANMLPNSVGKTFSRGQHP
jgi:sulfite reductase alpha subunit-like flavoprotein